PHGHSKENIIKPENEIDEKLADVDNMDGEKERSIPPVLMKAFQTLREVHLQALNRLKNNASMTSIFVDLYISNAWSAERKYSYGLPVPITLIKRLEYLSGAY